VPTPIYHFTHIDNLTGLLGIGKFLCKNEMIKQNAQYRSAAFESVQTHRESFQVPVSKGGSIHDYVPFY
jgi:hypothetical protein